MKIFFCSLLCLIISGCSAQSGNILIGTSSYGFSLAEQREALRIIEKNNVLPVGATIIGPVDASRCHRNTLDAEPTNELIINDLKMFAYANGADGITDIQIKKESGLLSNCWYVLTGKAVMYKYSEK